MRSHEARGRSLLLTLAAVLFVTGEAVRVAFPSTKSPPPFCAKKKKDEEEGEEKCMRGGPIESEREERSKTGRTVGMHDGGGVWSVPRNTHTSCCVVGHGRSRQSRRPFIHVNSTSILCKEEEGRGGGRGEMHAGGTDRK